MTPGQELSFAYHFAELTDPRIDRSKLHELLDIIAIAICAVIAGADSWDDIEEFGRAKRDWLKTFLALPNGIPSHNTFARVGKMNLTSRLNVVTCLLGANKLMPSR